MSKIFIKPDYYTITYHIPEHNYACCDESFFFDLESLRRELQYISKEHRVYAVYKHKDSTFFIELTDLDENKKLWIN